MKHTSLIMCSLLISYAPTVVCSEEYHIKPLSNEEFNKRLDDLNKTHAIDKATLQSHLDHIEAINRAQQEGTTNENDANIATSHSKKAIGKLASQYDVSLSNKNTYDPEIVNKKFNDAMQQEKDTLQRDQKKARDQQEKIRKRNEQAATERRKKQADEQQSQKNAADEFNKAAGTTEGSNDENYDTVSQNDATELLDRKEKNVFQKMLDWIQSIFQHGDIYQAKREIQTTNLDEQNFYGSFARLDKSQRETVLENWLEFATKKDNQGKQRLTDFQIKEVIQKINDILPKGQRLVLAGEVTGQPTELKEKRNNKAVSTDPLDKKIKDNNLKLQFVDNDTFESWIKKQGKHDEYYYTKPTQKASESDISLAGNIGNWFSDGLSNFRNEQEKQKTAQARKKSK